MQAIEFPEQTLVIAKDQPQYVPLPVHIADTPEREYTCCMKLTPEEIAEIVATGCIWNTQLTFGASLPSCKNEYIKATILIY